MNSADGARTKRESRDQIPPNMIWKPVPGFADYEVSEHGDVRRNLKMLVPHRVQGSGRKRYSLSKNGISHKMHAAHVVALAFIGPKPFEDAFVCHSDGFEHNNHYSNLRWASHRANMADVTIQRVARKSLGQRPISQADRLNAEAAKFLRDHG